MMLYWKSSIPDNAKIKIIEIIWIIFFKIGWTSNVAIKDSFSFRLIGFIHICPSYQPDSSYSTFSDVNLLKIWFQPRYNLIDRRNGKDKLLKRLIKMYFKVEVLKYALPEEMIRNIIKVNNQYLISIKENDFFDFGQEKILDLDNSINSLVGCWSLGTGQLDLFIK